MAAELGLLSLTQLQKLAQHQQLQPQHPTSYTSASTSWMWNPKKVAQDEDDSWEVRAFEQDVTGNINGTTWPPASYTCTFCRREFRSAQALGGHMNVHRRDRARLHQAPPGMNNPSSPSAASSSTILIPSQEFVRTGGLCLFYSLANPNATFLTPREVNSCMESTYPTNNLISPCPPNYTHLTTPHSKNSLICHSSNTEPSASNGNENNFLDNIDQNKKGSAIEEELDLELRLGRH